MTTTPNEEEFYARTIVEGFLSREEFNAELPRGVSVADVEADAEDFAADLEVLALTGAPIPAMRIQAYGERDMGLVPVALSTLLGETYTRAWPYRDWRQREYPYSPRFAFDVAIATESAMNQAVGQYESISEDRARETFIDRAANFLATRFRAVMETGDREYPAWPAFSMLTLRQRKRGVLVQAPGCTFTVSTNSSGLRVHWSGAYRISWNYFSQPTSPISAPLQAGTYVFGVDGGAFGNAIQPDSAVVSLPGAPSVHLNY